MTESSLSLTANASPRVMQSKAGSLDSPRSVSSSVSSVSFSVAEGEDKPLEYPDMFAASDLMILTKIDLLPYVDFDVGRCVEYAHRINPDIHVLQLSARTGEGMAAWTAWITEARLRVSHSAKMAGQSLARVADHA